MSDDPVCDLCGEPAARHPSVRDAHPFTSDDPHPAQLPAADRRADRRDALTAQKAPPPAPASPSQE
jgi:hypothetical protein